MYSLHLQYSAYLPCSIFCHCIATMTSLAPSVLEQVRVMCRVQLERDDITEENLPSLVIEERGRTSYCLINDLIELRQLYWKLDLKHQWCVNDLLPNRCIWLLGNEFHNLHKALWPYRDWLRDYRHVEENIPGCGNYPPPQFIEAAWNLYALHYMKFRDERLAACVGLGMLWTLPARLHTDEFWDVFPLDKMDILKGMQQLYPYLHPVLITCRWKEIQSTHMGLFCPHPAALMHFLCRVARVALLSNLFWVDATAFAASDPQIHESLFGNRNVYKSDWKEWAITILSLNPVEPSPPVDLEVVVPQLNDLLERLELDDRVEPNGRLSTLTAPSPVGQALVALYYQVIVEANVTSTSMLPYMLSVTLAAVGYGIGCHEQKLTSTLASLWPLSTIMRVTNVTPCEFLHGLETILPMKFPQPIVQHLVACETSILDAILWAEDPRIPRTFYDTIEDLKYKTGYTNNCYWPCPCLNGSLPEERDPSLPYPSKPDTDWTFVNHVMLKVQSMAYKRLESMCVYLKIPLHLPVIYRAWLRVRFWLREYKIHHLDHLLLSSMLYAVKVLTYPINFNRILTAYFHTRSPQIGLVTCQRIIRQVPLPGFKVGTILDWYHQVFVPRLTVEKIDIERVEVAEYLRSRKKGTSSLL